MAGHNTNYYYVLTNGIAIGTMRAATVPAGWLQPLLVLARRWETILWICDQTSLLPALSMMLNRLLKKYCKVV
jgi:hypothetical protein